MVRNRILLLLAGLLAVSGCAGGGADPYNRAVEHYGRGRVNESIGEYQQAIRVNPSDPLPKFNLAVIYQDQGRKDEAEKLYRAILAQHPEFAPAWSNLASLQEAGGQMGAAEQSYRRAVEADRSDSWSASQFGYFLLRAGRLDEASALFEEALRRNPKCANAWFGLGEIAEKRDDMRTALKSYDRAMFYNPSDIQALLRSADLRVRKGDRAGAVALLRRATVLDPRRGDIHFLMGRLLSEDGKWKEAEKAFELARQNGVPPAECDRELGIIYARLAEECGIKAELNGAR